MRGTALTIGAALMLLGAAPTQASAEPADRVWFAGVFRGTEDIALGQDSANSVTTLMVGRDVNDWVSVTLDYSGREIAWVERIACPGGCPGVTFRGAVAMESFTLLLRPGWRFSETMAVEGMLGLMRWTRDATPFRSELDGTDSVRGVALSRRLTDRWAVSIEYRQANLFAPRTYFPNEVESKSIGFLYRF